MKPLHIGGKLRRLRQERRLTQTQMAAELEISASYLNLIESNRRPLTAPVLLRLAHKFNFEIRELSSDDTEHVASELMEALSDPMFDDQDVKASDVRDLVTTLPSIGRAFLRLYRSYHSQLGGSNKFANSASDSDPALTHLPSEEVSDFIQRNMNYFPSLERVANVLWDNGGLALQTLHHDLIRVLSQRFSVRVEILPTSRMPGLLRLYDPATRKLDLSEMLPLASRTFQIAHQIALLGYQDLLNQLCVDGKFSSAESDVLARSALANYFASAVMMPYERFINSVKSTRYDIEILQSRFGVSFEQACHRLTTLRQEGNEGIPFHLVRVDIAGNISKRFSASGIRIARFGAACPRWNVYDAFATPGMIRLQVSRMPDGQAFFCVARTVGSAGHHSLRSGLTHPIEKRAIALGCAVQYARDLVYADGLHLEDEQLVTPIGVSCRACPRTDCAERASPALSQRLAIDENRRGYSPYMIS